MDKKILSLLGLSLAFSGCEKEQPVTKGKERWRYLQQNEWESQLQKVAETPAPKNLEFGAMCYEIAFYEQNVYNCPVCLQKTIYDKSDQQLMSTLTLLPEYLDKASDIYNLRIPIKLVTTGLCSHCSPDGPRELQWEVMNGEQQVMTPFEPFDLYILKAFAEKKLVVKDMTDEETPLKNYLPRLRQLLGLEEVEAK